MYTISQFDEDSGAEQWDRFVLEESVNGTVFHTRRFLNYHTVGRFTDTSIVVHDGDTLAAVVPACVRDDGYFSHSGSSYGGPVIRPGYYRIRYLEPLVTSITEHFDSRLGMRLAPSIFSEVTTDALLFLLRRTHKLRLELGVYRSLSGVDDFVDGIVSQSTRTATRQLIGSRYDVREGVSEREYRLFHTMLSDNLARHDVQPTHTVRELLDLRERLGHSQVLLLGYEGSTEPTAGTWIVKASKRAWHAFYIAKSYERGHDAAVPALLTHAMCAAKKGGASYLNLGICTEDDGRELNRGLFHFKESLGGATIFRPALTPK